MIDFTTVSREFRSLVTRRRELITFLGTVFAGLGIFLQNALQGQLPPALKGLQRHVFAYYAALLMVPSLVLALRMARLHGGMVLNGILYARLMREQTFTSPGDPRRAARHNFFGVSFIQFLLADLIAGFSAFILTLALHAPLTLAAGVGIAVVVVAMGLYFHFHHRAAAFALKKIETDACAPFDRNEWEGHVAGSLEDANQGMLGDIGFVGLIVFSVFETLSGLGQIDARAATDLTADAIKTHGPLAYAVLMFVTCLLSLFTYVRVRLAVGRFSLMLDPTDRPFRPLQLTDSLLGYVLLAFLFAVSLHLLLILVAPALDRRWPAVLLAIDAAAFALAILAEQITLFVAGRTYRGS